MMIKDNNSILFKQILKRILKHRQNYPEKYSVTKIKNPDEKRISLEIDKILEKYKN
jgi:hypothetical protein